MTITANIKTRALEVLDGMDEIVRNEMVRRGVYVTAEIVNPDLREQGAVCGGRQACAIGSAYLAAGVRLKRDEDGDLVLPGVEQRERDEFLRRRPALRTALEALNAEADAYIARNKLEEFISGAFWHDSIEALFESKRGDGWDDDGNWRDGRPLVRRDGLRRIIERAKVRVNALETR